MKRHEIPFLEFGAMFILAIPFSLDIATSVVPGWHNTVMSPNFLITIIISITLLLVTIAYHLLSGRPEKISSALFIPHFFLTVHTVLFIRAPSLFLNIAGTDIKVLNRQITFASMLIVLLFTLFIVGQVVFGI